MLSQRYSPICAEYFQQLLLLATRLQEAGGSSKAMQPEEVAVSVQKLVRNIQLVRGKGICWC